MNINRNSTCTLHRNEIRRLTKKSYRGRRHPGGNEQTDVQLWKTVGWRFRRSPCSRVWSDRVTRASRRCRPSSDRTARRRTDEIPVGPAAARQPDVAKPAAQRRQHFHRPPGVTGSGSGGGPVLPQALLRAADEREVADQRAGVAEFVPADGQTVVVDADRPKHVQLKHTVVHVVDVDLIQNETLLGPVEQVVSGLVSVADEVRAGRHLAAEKSLVVDYLIVRVDELFNASMEIDRKTVSVDEKQPIHPVQIDRRHAVSSEKD
ncbi:hypothetical protein T07_5751 [Trichinella nelsoni]|uniref:Uncharacterized protein n=1 Tax=Trichinella nelsoni TaxID=6336 RepID=A0A0V0S7D8_9BILA|nr:hypothetical protein T07_5751 [Trichinella nelsoni]